jgi:hypothetical protein
VTLTVSQPVPEAKSASSLVVWFLLIAIATRSLSTRAVHRLFRRARPYSPDLLNARVCGRVGNCSN